MKISVLAKASVLAMALALPAKAEVVLINVFEVPAGQENEVVAGWEKARDFLSQEPGYLSTRLHRSLSDDARFSLVNVARWESPEAFELAISKMNEADVFPRIDGLAFTAGLYQVVREDTPDK